MKSWLIILLIFFQLIIKVQGQERWTNTYLSGLNPVGESICEYYDKGYLITGRYGPNYPKLNWLIKTDINGNVLWNKTLGNGMDYLVLTANTKTDKEGNIFLVGSTDTYNTSDYDPIIMKLDSCGEKEWCNVFFEEGNNFSNDLVITQDNGVVVLLRYMSTIHFTDRTCLSKLDKDGTVQWTHCYNSPDTNLYNDDAKDVIITPDGGFLITGVCDYVDPNPPHYWWSKPYYIKTDSLGNFEWETIVHKEISELGGYAWNTVINSNSTFYYSSISHYYYDQSKDAAAMLKMDLNGNLIDIYDIAPPNEYGKMISLLFINDTTLAASASWGTESDHTPKAIIIDTLGNILTQKVLLDNDWMAKTEKTFDNKLLFFTNKYEEDSDQFYTYLFKLNQNLEDDTLYTFPFTYDSLCPYSIVSDTIVQDDCGLIVGMDEVKLEKEEERDGILIYPNPAQNKFQVSSFRFQVSSCIIKIFDIFGRKAKEINVPKGQNKIEVDVEGWKKGLYLIMVRDKNSVIGSEKVIVN